MGKTILIVEDDSDIRLGLEVRLKASGYGVETAIDAESGTKSAMTLNPDLIILDLGLPDQNGFEVIRRLQEDEKASKIPVVILTAHGTTENLTKSLSQESIVTFLQKPVSNEELLATIQIGLGEKTA